ncbi:MULTISPECIES: glycosyltransferase [Halomonadaceae]|uniref:glycosyltransferase n=1 Tax=Halomonadaceae TaxID=28256 RepID=UPI001866C443|nr:glycosyltransferase [Halomonas sp. 3A7M]
MKRHIFVIIRYSVLTESKSAWMIGRDSEFDDYKRKLFDSERLRLHENLFRNVTFPSLLKMDSSSTTVLLFTSDELPSAFLENIKDLISPHNNIRIILTPKVGVLNAHIENNLEKELKSFEDDVCYATVRLDDDDAMSDSFHKKLFYYVRPQFKGHAISFPYGFAGVFDGDNYTGFYERKIPMTAQGLSYIDVYTKDSGLPRRASVFHLGNHMKVDDKVPLIMNPSKSMYVRTIHEHSDIYSDRLRDKASVTKLVSNELVKKSFSGLTILELREREA